jgi:hypothetical protein
VSSSHESVVESLPCEIRTQISGGEEEEENSSMEVKKSTSSELEARK